MCVLSRNEIIRRLVEVRRDHYQALTISPLLDGSQIDHDAVDVRLGTYFIAFKETDMPSLDLHRPELHPMIFNYQTCIHVPLGHAVAVHPSSLVLGCTLEYIRVPADVSCEVLTRSTWGRLGLMIATAVWVHPLFTGCLTFEIANYGNVPVSLPPGITIAQLVFHQGTEKDEAVCQARKRSPQYTGITRPWHPKLETELADLRKAREIGDHYHGSEWPPGSQGPPKPTDVGTPGSP
jgi:dCTP deaminase